MDAPIHSAETEVLVLFGKQPCPGRVKTRLTPPLSAVQASDLYQAFLLDVCARPRPSAQELRLAVAPPLDRSAFSGQLPEQVVLMEQQGPDLSARLIDLFESQFERSSVRRVVVRNTDSPLLPQEWEQEAFRVLERGAEIVLGPDLGGGYYLVGMSKPFSDLFRLEMSVPSNFERTLERARSLTNRVELLDPAPDVDRIEDLRGLGATLAKDAAARAFAPRTTRMMRTLGYLL